MTPTTLNQTGTTMAGTTRLSVRNIRKSFGTHEVLRGISLDARDGDVISLLGASGSGKSTFLRCINLLEVADHGEISVDGELIQMEQRGGKNVPADRRQVDRIRSELGMVFQSFNLWSHMTILENVIEGPVHVLKRPRAEVHRRGGSARWKRSASPRSAMPIPRICRAASSSVRRSPVRWR